MTQQEIQERNEQIAIMLGLKKIKIPKGMMEDLFVELIWVEKEFPEIYPSDGHIPYEVDEFWAYFNPQVEKLVYDSNWNWLMKAVEFISKNGFTYSIYKNDKLYCCSIKIDRTITDFILIKNESQKEAVFIAVSDFAKLYNNKEL